MKARRRTQPKGRSVDLQALREVRELLGDASRQPDLLIEHLHRIQDSRGHLSAAHLAALAHEMGLSQTEVYEVASFYHHFDVVKEGEQPPPPLTVRVCDSISCAMAGAEDLIGALQAALGDGVRVQPVPCVGRCEQAPVAVVGQNPVGRADVAAVQKRVDANAVSPTLPPARGYAAYRADGGYALLLQVRSGTLEVNGQAVPAAEHIMNVLEHGGLRGLGGAGFPTGRKWRIMHDQPRPRLMAVNSDEGEPGTFKDRFFLERDPHRFLEGMLIAAEVVGIESIYIYLRDEYPAVRAVLQRELAALIADPPCPLPPIYLRRGAGAYICGEESAMIESIEGKRGEPRLRPPYVAQVGLFGHPTLEHNVETLYWVRDLVARGPEWFAGHGRNGRKGLRAFSVSGRVSKPGVHIAPAGITLRELIDEFCGGMAPGHQLYGYFPGGASGGILPASLADVPLDFDTLQPHGCFIGSAAIIVLSDRDRARDLALNAMRFFSHESCGQCTPCRVGTSKAVKLMERPVWDQELLEELSQTMVDASICGLGQAAPNPARCVMKYFPEELVNDEGN
jgi:formate dehydrogenase beta subunit